MDSSQHHFPVALVHQTLDFFHDLFRLSASDSSSGIRNDAVAAELITAVLDLNKCPGVIRDLVDVKCLILSGFPNIDQRILFHMFSCEIFIQQRYQVFFPVIADDHVYGGVLFQLFSCRLHVAACCHHHCVRIHFLCPVQHLPGLAVRDIGDRTGVDHIHIGLLLKRHDLIARLLQKLLHRLRFVGIHLTAQIVKCSLSHALISPILYKLALDFSRPPLYY